MLSRLQKLNRPVRRLFSNYLADESIDHQQFNRHQTHVTLHDFYSEYNDVRNVAPSSVLVGEVILMDNTHVGDFSVLKGDLNMVKLDESSTVMDNCYISTVSELDKTGQNAWMYISVESLILSGASLVSAELDRGVTIGPRSVVCEGVKIGEFSVIGANSVVPPYRYIPGHQLWAGNPVRFVKDLSKQELASLKMFKHFLRKLLKQDKKHNLSNNSAFLFKEILDDLELDLKNEDLSLEDLEKTIDLMEKHGNEIFFARELVESAKSRLAQNKITQKENL